MFFPRLVNKFQALPVQRQFYSSIAMALLKGVADVDIDESGTFKYILIQAKDTKANEEKFIVRGYASCEYHADIFDVTERRAPKGVELHCVGGGRIKHEPEANKLKVYGYSQGFGQADHKKSVEILKGKYPKYDITYSNDGY